LAASTDVRGLSKRLRDLLVEQLAQLARTNVETLQRTLAGETQSLDTTPDSAPRRARPRRDGERLEPLSQAISLALQEPAVTLQDLDYEQLAELDQPGVDVLLEIVHIVADSPEIRQAALLERFRDHRYHTRLEELATRAQIIPEDGFGPGYAGAVQKLLEVLRDAEIAGLKHRISAGDATDGDRERLNTLLKQQSKLAVFWRYNPDVQNRYNWESCSRRKTAASG